MQLDKHFSFVVNSNTNLIHYSSFGSDAVLKIGLSFIHVPLTRRTSQPVPIAQVVEHLFREREVVDSIPGRAIPKA